MNKYEVDLVITVEAETDQAAETFVVEQLNETALLDHSVVAVLELHQ
jgi:hypothetical protein